KLTAANEYVKKYPKSLARKRVADNLSMQIGGVSDLNQRLTLTQKFMTIFTNEAESGDIEPILIDTYVGLNRFDDAFSDSAAYLAKHPDAVSVLISLAIVGTEQAKQKNAKYVKQSHDYGMKA